ncbi:MAG: hypothetical protein R3236_06440 [Phycisphaeraceae bacterium]|nr:hypothetical protein [Phycisphaeraceae bacterium]
MTAPLTDSDLPWGHWLKSARIPAVSEALEEIYSSLAESAESIGPVCELSGRCCRFESFDHRLYATGLEIAWMFAQLDEPGLGRLTGADLPGMDGCPFQVAGRCSVHPIRPLGCRVFYCDPKATQWQQDASEKYLKQIGVLHETHGLPYRYMEWRAGLLDIRRWLERTDDPD